MVFWVYEIGFGLWSLGKWGIEVMEFLEKVLLFSIFLVDCFVLYFGDRYVVGFFRLGV